jgi:multiple antibiotic resistance protein
MAENSGLVSLGAVFTLFFVTLGPLKILGPFAQMTHALDDTAIRKLALRAFVLALIAALLGGFGGQALAHNWHIQVPVMLLTGGLIFFLIGLRQVLEQYEPPHAEKAPLPAAPLAAAMRVAFPVVVTPYGIAALIALLANSHDGGRTGSIVALLVGVMVLNLLAMLYARKIMAGMTLIGLQILGAVLGVLQVALAVEMILRALGDLDII